MQGAEGGVAAAAPAAAKAFLPPPLPLLPTPPVLMAFSRDAAEALWRHEHLGVGAGQRDVTGLALDLMLLSLIASGNDYLPAVQGLQLSNKYRPGLWDLYLGMRQEERWAGHCLVERSCLCSNNSTGGGGGGGVRGGGGGDCPSVRINAGMLAALLREHHHQRFVFFDTPTAASSSSDIVWDGERLAAAAAMARQSYSGSDDEVAAGPTRRSDSGGAGAAIGGGRAAKPGFVDVAALRGMEAQPENYLQVGGWVGG